MNDTADQSTLLNVQGEQAWTKEPWSIDTDGMGDLLDVLDANGTKIASFEALYEDGKKCMAGEAGAQRAITCINATAGIADPLLAITKARQALAGAVTWHQGDPYRNGCETERKAWREQMALLDEAIKALGVKP